jgi:CheY-like chemotaxis protein
MQILLVEDNKAFAKSVGDSLGKHGTVVQAESRDSAIDLLRSSFFDLIVLDLSIPTSDNGLDRAPEHGQSVFYSAQDLAPGTPVFILTGSDPDEFSLSLARYGQRVDLWGTGEPMPTIDYYVKDRVDKLIDVVEKLAAQVSETDRIAIDTWGKNLNLGPEHKRALRVFTRLRGGVSCVVKQLTGGLSATCTLRVLVNDAHGHERVLCVAKLGYVDKVLQEKLAIDNHVELLRMGVATPLLNHLYLGLHGFAAIFYPLAEGYDQTLFEIVAGKIDVAASVAIKLREGMQRWVGAGTIKEVNIGDLRRRVLSDEAMTELQEKIVVPDYVSIERIQIRVREASIHGDLHCGNVLVSGGGVPVLIDFGDAGLGYSCQDPIALELSLIFHPDSVSMGISSPLAARIGEWPDRDAYLKGNPFAPFIQACRDWAYQQSGSDAAVLAAAYAFAVRQLKYETVSAQVALTLIAQIAASLRASE